MMSTACPTCPSRQSPVAHTRGRETRRAPSRRGPTPTTTSSLFKARSAIPRRGCSGNNDPWHGLLDAGSRPVVLAATYHYAKGV